MTAADKLCKLLDEYGITWKKRRGYIRWSKQTEYGITYYQAWPCNDGTVTLTVRDEYALTPEQVIAATLGSGTCELEETESYPSERGTVHVLECSECGHECEHVNGDYEHCPHCLARNKLF